MYLSRILLDDRTKDTARGLLRPDHFHANLENCFPGPKQRKLWRIDRVGNNTYMLIVSKERTEFTPFVERFSPMGIEKVVETSDYDLFLGRLKEGMVCRFRLVANPVHSITVKGREGRGVVRAHVGPENQKQWLLQRESQMGVSIDPEKLTVVSDHHCRFKSKGQTITLLKVGFEGLLTIKNIEKIKKALTQGIGRGKAYGCGLLTVIPLTKNN